MSSRIKISGVIVPLLTPFDDQGRIDPTATRQLVDFLVSRGVHGLFPLGTTGEMPLLTLKERQHMAEIVVEAARGRLPVIIHTGAASTRETMELTKHAQSIGADGAALVTPYYYHLSDDALLRHFEAAALHTPDLPIYLYNIPQLTGNAISQDLLTRLLERCPNINGMKDSSGSLSLLMAATTLKDGHLNTAVGSDGLILAGIASGVDACVSGNANVLPELVVALYHAAEQGDLILARRLQHQLDLASRAMGHGDIALLKAMLTRRGLNTGTVRAPLESPDDEQIEPRWQQLVALGLDLSLV